MTDWTELEIEYPQTWDTESSDEGFELPPAQLLMLHRATKQRDAAVEGNRLSARANARDLVKEALAGNVVVAPTGAAFAVAPWEEDVGIADVVVVGVCPDEIYGLAKTLGANAVAAVDEDDADMALLVGVVNEKLDDAGEPEQVEERTENPILLETLTENSRGDQVKAMQALLNIHGAGVPLTGKVDARTLAALYEVQGWIHVPQDGVCGPRTWWALLRGQERYRSP